MILICPVNHISATRNTLRMPSPCHLEGLNLTARSHYGKIYMRIASLVLLIYDYRATQ